LRIAGEGIWGITNTIAPLHVKPTGVWPVETKIAPLIAVGNFFQIAWEMCGGTSLAFTRRNGRWRECHQPEHCSGCGNDQMRSFGPTVSDRRRWIFLSRVRCGPLGVAQCSRNKGTGIVRCSSCYLLSSSARRSSGKTLLFPLPPELVSAALFFLLPPKPRITKRMRRTEAKNRRVEGATPVVDLPTLRNGAALPQGQGYKRVQAVPGREQRIGAPVRLRTDAKTPEAQV
jgi:hypothetical protein